MRDSPKRPVAFLLPAKIDPKVGEFNTLILLLLPYSSQRCSKRFLVKTCLGLEG